MDLGLLVVIVVFAVFVPVGIIAYLVVIPRMRRRENERKSASRANRLDP